MTGQSGVLLMIRLHPTAGGIALVAPKGYEFLTYENGYTISAPEYSKILTEPVRRPAHGEASTASPAATPATVPISDPS